MSGGCCPVGSPVVASELVGRSPDEHSSLSTRSAKFPTRCLNSVGPASRPGVTQVALQCHSTQRKARLERYNAQGSHEEIMAGLLPPVFMGFITGWKPFAEANNLQIGDRCELLKELDEEAGTSVRYSDHKKNEESGWVRHLR